MLSFLPPAIRGGLLVFLVALTTVVFGIPLIIFGFLKLLLPFKFWHRFFLFLCILMSNILWLKVVNSWMKLINKTNFEVLGNAEFSRKEWYLMVMNHQSWADILVMIMVFHLRIPYYKFFVKKELLWVPIFGLAFWALEYPYMKRYSKEEIARNPELKGKDLETIKKDSERFKDSPVTIISFAEGTRFSKEKHESQNSPYCNLLKPKAGGIATAIYSMGDYLSCILDVTIVYKGGIESLWQYLCGRIDTIYIHIQRRDLPDKIGNYAGDEEYRNYFLEWLHNYWEEKDRLIDEIRKSTGD